MRVSKLAKRSKYHHKHDIQSSYDPIKGLGDWNFSYTCHRIGERNAAMGSGGGLGVSSGSTYSSGGQ